MKSGFISVVGRTNAGKSTLINSLLGEKLALVSHKINATRRKIRAIVMHDENQLIFIDTPGLHKSDKLFNQSLIQSAKKAIQDCDVILFVASAKDSTRDYEDFLSLNSKKPHLLLLNKIDLLSQAELLKKIKEYESFSSYFKALLPYSSKVKTHRKPLLDELCKYLNFQNYYYDTDILSPDKEKDIYKELILEALFESFSDELPYSSDVLIENVSQKNKTLHIEANIITDTNSHKVILIGQRAEAIKRLGIRARKKLENFTLTKVNLKLFVSLKKAWTKDKKFLENILNS